MLVIDERTGRSDGRYRDGLQGRGELYRSIVWDQLS